MSSAQAQLQKLQEETNETNVTVSQKESELLDLRQQLVDMGVQKCECLDRLSSASVDSTVELGKLQQIQLNLEHIKTRVKCNEGELHLLLKRLTQIRTLESRWKKILADSVKVKEKDEPTTVSWRYGPLSTTATSQSQLKPSEVPTEVEKAITVTTETKDSTVTTPKAPTTSASSYADLIADSIDLCSRSKKKVLRKLSKKSDEERRAKNNAMQSSLSSLSYGDLMAESLHLCSDIVIDDDKNKKSDHGDGSSSSGVDSSISPPPSHPRQNMPPYHTLPPHPHPQPLLNPHSHPFMGNIGGMDIAHSSSSAPPPFLPTSSSYDRSSTETKERENLRYATGTRRFSSKQDRPNNRHRH